MYHSMIFFSPLTLKRDISSLPNKHNLCCLIQVLSSSVLKYLQWSYPLFVRLFPVCLSLHTSVT